MFLPFVVPIFRRENVRILSTLPCLPVPELHETLKKLLISARPFLTPEEYCKSENELNGFGSPGGLGECLQDKLLERADCKDNWKRYALPMYSSIGITLPQQKFNKEEEMLIFAAKIAAGALQFKKLLDERKISLESLGNDALDMNQYENVFGTCRKPCGGQDILIYNSQSDYIVVAHQNNYYKVCVKENNVWLNYYCIYQILLEIVKDHNYGPPIGLLTSDCRDNWSQSYIDIMRNKINIESIQMIEGSLFLLCLDTNCAIQEINHATTNLVQCLHGGGPNINSANRWFDKTIQFIVGKTGAAGVNFEASPADVDVMVGILEFLVRFMSTCQESKLTSKNKPLKLCFDLDECIRNRICYAEHNLNSLVCDLQLICFKFTGYGKSYIRKEGLSPDSYIQMAIQLAYFKISGQPALQFEIISLRKFKKGRRESVRSSSNETVRFVTAMENCLLSQKSKANALTVAVQYQKKLVSEAFNGEGIDNHLFGLKMIACEEGICEPSIFSDPSYYKSSCMQLYTNQLNSKIDAFIGVAPMVQNGYGCFYAIHNEEINITISVHSSSSTTNADLFSRALQCSLKEMRCVLQS